MRLFKDPDKLSPRYIPEFLPHREKEIQLAENLFEGYRGYLRIIQFIGPAGSGKTSVAYHVGRSLERRIKGLKSIYLTLKLESGTKFTLYSSLARKIDPNLPVRSLGAYELLEYVLRYLKHKNLHLLIIADEVDYYVKTSRHYDAVFDLTRLNEIYLGQPINIAGIIFISRDPRWRELLDKATRSSLGNVVVNFKPYSRDQVYDIISYRASEAFIKGAIMDDVLNYISDLTAEANGDIRFALDLLFYSGMLAENENAIRVTLEHVRHVLMQIEPTITSEDIINLDEKEKIILLAISYCLKRFREPYVSIDDVWDEYKRIVVELHTEKVDRRKFHKIVESIYYKGIIDLKGFNVGISKIPVEKLSRFLNLIINRLNSEIRKRVK